jgi:RNAse (barnase) inhibitor barstar
MFRPNFISENEPALSDRLRANCLKLAKASREQGKDLTPLWDSLLDWAREQAAALERVDAGTARDFLGMYFDLVAECKSLA